MQIHRKAPSYLLYFFLVLFVFLLFPSRFFFYTGLGLDESWNMGLHLAYKYKLVFGRDFIFGFGPLGILHTRFPVSVNIFVYILFDIYFLATLWHVLKKILQGVFQLFFGRFCFSVHPAFSDRGHRGPCVLFLSFLSFCLFAGAVEPCLSGAGHFIGCHRVLSQCKPGPGQRAALAAGPDLCVHPQKNGRKSLGRVAGAAGAPHPGRRAIVACRPKGVYPGEFSFAGHLWGCDVPPSGAGVADPVETCLAGADLLSRAGAVADNGGPVEKTNVLWIR